MYPIHLIGKYSTLPMNFIAEPPRGVDWLYSPQAQHLRVCREEAREVPSTPCIRKWSVGCGEPCAHLASGEACCQAEAQSVRSEDGRLSPDTTQQVSPELVNQDRSWPEQYADHNQKG